MLTSIKVLLSSIVDYAGLFPPAQLDLREAMANYACDRMTPYRWMLGAFVVPDVRLDEFAELAAAFPLKPWRLSVLVSRPGEIEATLERSRSGNPHSEIALQSLEFPPLPPEDIGTLLPHLPEGIDAFFEIPLNQDLDPYLDVLQGTGAAAKIRTGGLTADAFPDAQQLCQFIAAIAQAHIPFKATAGLHHPLPAHRRVTDQPDSPSAAMHGFLNLVVLAALLDWQKVTAEEGVEILKEPTIAPFQFQEESVSWRDRSLTLSELETTRRRCFRSFGSCSFHEPIVDLEELGLLGKDSSIAPVPSR